MTKEVFRRLGIPMRDCPRCGEAFSVVRTPRWWITTLVDGDLVEGTPEDDLFCSSECAHAEVANRKMAPPQYAGHITLMVDEDNEEPVR